MKVEGRLRVPGDKSISHRALMLCALGGGPSRITGILESADVRSTASALRQLGVPIPELSADFVIGGVGLRGLRAPTAPVDCGNSGTTARLLAGIVAGSPHAATFVGDASLSRRPMRRVADPLMAMGAGVELPPEGGLPMAVRGGTLRSVEWRSEIASAQVKSAILLAALVAGVGVVLEEPSQSRDHTERMLAARGIDVRSTATRVALASGAPLAPLDTSIPSDPSSAAFFAALAALADSGELTLEHVCVNETRTGFFEVLRRMGAHVRYRGRTVEGGEPVAEVAVSPGRLRGISVKGQDVPAMIDELPLLACLGARADGDTIITGASELRVKESDRIAVVVANLCAIGADAAELPDGLRVHGSQRALRGVVATHGDHRIAMAFGVLGALPGNELSIDDPPCVGVSYPGFWRDLQRVRRQ